MSKKQADKDMPEDTEVTEQPGADLPGGAGAGEEEVTVDAVRSTENLANSLVALQEELEEQKDLQLRAIAEAENVRRRAETDIANGRKFAIEAFARELLAVRDSLELASNLEIELSGDDVVAKMEEGLQLTLKQIDHVFEKFNIREVETSPGEKPDPELHQAMSLIDSDEFGAGEIVSIMQKGYRLHDRLLRPVMVLVAKQESKAQED